jgi:hypothetical protein
LFSPEGAPVTLAQDRITIARTAATVDAIPASHSIGIEVRDRVGANPVLDYLVREGLDVSVPAIGGNFRSGRNFYSRKEAEVDYTEVAQRVREDAEHASAQLTDLAQRAEHPALGQARDKLAKANALSPDEANPETAKQAMDNFQRAKELLAQARRQNLPAMRTLELERVIDYFKELRKLAKGSEEAAFDALVKTAERSIADPRPEFEAHLADLKSKIFGVLVRQDWFISDRFNWYLFSLTSTASLNVIEIYHDDFGSRSAMASALKSGHSRYAASRAHDAVMFISEEATHADPRIGTREVHVRCHARRK